LYIHSVIPAKHATYISNCIVAAEGFEAKASPRNVIIRNVGITARINPLLAAWNSLSLDILFMIIV
jgi:hypothetical protein